MELENVGEVVADCTKGTALVTMLSADAELDEDAASEAISGAGNYTLKSMAKVEEEDDDAGDE